MCISNSLLHINSEKKNPGPMGLYVTFEKKNSMNIKFYLS